MAEQMKKEKEEATKRQLYEGSTASMSSSITLDQEDAQRKGLMDALIRDATPNAPVVKVLTNIQGIAVVLLSIAPLSYIASFLLLNIQIFSFLTLYKGAMGKLRRNLENTNGFCQATHKEVMDIKATLSTMAAALEAVCSQVQAATFVTNMKGCDISEFFPVEKKEQIELFMDRSHPEWENRKTEFYHFLYTIASKNKKGFGRGLIKAIFSRHYISTAKWPSFG